MKRTLILVSILALFALGSAIVAHAHSCEEDPGTGEERCEETPVMPNWRDGNYVPLFDIDREDEQERYNAQRWRDECGGYDGDGNYRSDQQCTWVRAGTSLFPNPDAGQGQPAPNEVHAGHAASHCFLFEFAHQCEDHLEPGREGSHDAHGGAAYVDVCLTANPESKYCDDGPTDTQAGVTIMDHNACGVIVPIAACTDEYHLIRPLDTEFTTWQMEQSAAYIQRIVDDPELYLCGYREYRSGNPICPADEDGPLPGSGGGASAAVPDPARTAALRAQAVSSLLAAGVPPEELLAASVDGSDASATRGAATGILLPALVIGAALTRRLVRIG